MITVVDYKGKTFVIDGKQRTTTIVSFMCNEFADSDGNKWDDGLSKIRFQQAAPQSQFKKSRKKKARDCLILLNFSAASTHSQNSSPPDSLASCMDEETMTFVDTVFNRAINEGDKLGPRNLVSTKKVGWLLLQRTIRDKRWRKVSRGNHISCWARNSTTNR